MSLSKGEIVVQNFMEKNDQPRKNLDKLTIYFFFENNFINFFDSKPCQSLSVAKT